MASFLTATVEEEELESGVAASTFTDADFVVVGASGDLNKDTLASEGWLDGVVEVEVAGVGVTNSAAVVPADATPNVAEGGEGDGS